MRSRAAKTSVVTARFCTREVHTIARVEILGPDGLIETLEGTTIHPIWSEDRQDWVPLGELQPGEQLRCGRSSIQTSDFALQTSTVLSLIILNQPIAVYNIEVHGEHVYQVNELGVLVHNSYADEFARRAKEAFDKLNDLRDNLSRLRKAADDVRDLTAKKTDFLSFDDMKAERLSQIAELERSLLKQIAEATKELDFWL